MSYPPPPPGEDPPGGSYPPPPQGSGYPSSGGGYPPPDGGGYPAGGGGYGGSGYPPPGGGGYGYPPPPPGAGGYGVPQTSQKALWSMILGILGLVCCGIFTGIPALLLGNSAKKEIDSSGGMRTGRGMAQAGYILGIVSIVLSVLGAILWGSGIWEPVGPTFPTNP